MTPDSFTDSFTGGVLVGVAASVIAYLIVTILLAPVGRYLRGRYRRLLFNRRARRLLNAIYDETNGDRVAVISLNSAAGKAAVQYERALLDHLLASRLIDDRGEWVGEYSDEWDMDVDMAVSLTSKGVREVEQRPWWRRMFGGG